MKRLIGKLMQSGGNSYECPVCNTDCSEFEVNKWTLSKFIYDRLVPAIGIHPFPLDELLLMTAAVVGCQPSHIFEWGTNIGKSARVFYETCKAFGISAEIHSIDLPDNIHHIEHPKEKRGYLVKGFKDVHLHLGDGLETALRIVSEGEIKDIKPLFFIDGDHSYESVKNELSTIIMNVPQANILLHDTFYQSEKSGYNIGPYAAITEVISNFPNKFKIISQNLGLPGMTLLWQG